MVIWQSIILGIVEGITEFLPISSTGHLIVVSDLIGVASSAFSSSFDIIIQLGAMMAVVVLYWKKFLDIKVLRKLAAAFIPTALIGLVLYGVAKAYLLNNIAVVLWAMLIGGVALILFEWYHSKKIPHQGEAPDVSQVSYRQAVIVGVFQSLAIIPGVSRSAATIVGGLLLGLHRTTIVEFSFLLAVPTILAASVLDVIRMDAMFTGEQWLMLSIGFVVSFVVALFSIKFLLNFVRNHNFISFGIYRIVAAVIFWLIIF